MVTVTVRRKENMSKKYMPKSNYVDIHCHCLPGIDDGPATMPEALALCLALVDDGITTAIATPHQLGRFNSCNGGAIVREKISILNEELKNNGIALTVKPGADVRADERICQLLKDDEVITLADGGKYILLELPHQIFIDIEPLIVELFSLGVQAIISHPERHFVLGNQDEVLFKWLNHSANLQVTAGSLIGQFGPAAQKAAWHLLSSGLACLVATDSHDLNGRRPCMRAAFQCISGRLGDTVARLVCIENPSRVLEGRDVVPSHLLSTSKLNYEHQRVPTSF